MHLGFSSNLAQLWTNPLRLKGFYHSHLMRALLWPLNFIIDLQGAVTLEHAASAGKLVRDMEGLKIISPTRLEGSKAPHEPKHICNAPDRVKVSCGPRMVTVKISPARRKEKAYTLSDFKRFALLNGLTGGFSATASVFGAPEIQFVVPASSLEDYWNAVGKTMRDTMAGCGANTVVSK